VTLALLAWPAIMAAPALWALFLDRHVHSRYGRVPAWQWALLGLPAAALVALAWLNHRHGLLYGPATGMEGGGGAAGAAVMRYDHGPLFFAAAAWNYVLLLAASAQLALAALHSQGAQRRVWLAFLLIAAVPWAANIAYIGFGLQLLGADPTPLSFAVSVAGFAWLIRSRQLFDIVPLARGLLFSELPDALLIVDRDGRVMESNAAAQVLAGQALPPGQPLAEWPRFGAALAAKLAEGAAGPLALGDRMYELRVRAIGPTQRQIGRLLQLRDVTEYHRAQVRVVHTLAERNAQLQKVAALQAELHEQALRDPLTGLLNRRALQQRFDDCTPRRAAQPQPLALVLLDVDHFKRINDSHGHATGDAVLRELGAALQAGLRAGDMVFRFGGEEFALLLPGADTVGAARRVDALREHLAAQPLPSVPERITFSAGVTAWPAGGDTLDALLRAADAAMYRAKAEGRDRVVAAEAGGGAAAAGGGAAGA
jgi:diguanylate cyclase (GGDEF)-like protein